MEIEKSAYRPIRAYLAEYLVAAWRQAQGGNPTLLGGNQRGHDVQDGDMLIDAKVLIPTSASERRAWPGHDWKVTRDRHKLFDPVETTHIALVAFPDEMPFETTAGSGRLSVTTSCTDAAIYLVFAEELNGLLDPGGSWRVLPLETSWLERHRVQ